VSTLRRYAAITRDVLEAARTPRDGSKGVLVLGMHRSGTSAITGLVSLLGPELGDPDDLMPADEANQEGYWESASLTDFQESLLEKLGGEWAEPPAVAPGWENDWRLVRRVGLARRTFREVYGDAREWLWKDPRTVLLLPFWRRVLRFEPIIVAIFRDPVEVADSLKARDGFEREHAISLWEKYNRALLANARGLPTFVAAYEDVVKDPVAVGWALFSFLEAQSLTVHRPDDDTLRSRVDERLRHNVRSASADTQHEFMSDVQRELLATLNRARGRHAAFGEVRGAETDGDLTRSDRDRDAHTSRQPLRG
jgi:hypothetical protein